MMQFGAGSIIMTLSCFAYIGAGAYSVQGIPYIIIGFLAVAVTLKLSAIIARKMKTDVFHHLVNVVLLVSSASLLWQVINGFMK